LLADGNTVISANTTGDQIIFETEAVERARIDSSGYLRLSSSSPGIQFNGDTAAANALDDYEEGTFTPSVYCTGNGVTLTPTARAGRYIKIGRKVCFTLYFTWTGGTGTGGMQVSSLPYASANNANEDFLYATTMEGTSAVTSGEWLFSKHVPNRTDFIIYSESGSSSGPVIVPAAGTIRISGSYFTA
jgi:hypothetical protein